jgi:hypothetical protein
MLRTHRIIRFTLVATIAAGTLTGQPRLLPDAQRTKNELNTLLNGYPPSVRDILSLDPALLSNQAYLSSYPALVSFLGGHPEVVRDASFYVGDVGVLRRGRSQPIVVNNGPQWNQVVGDVAAMFSFAIGLAFIVWLIRAVMEHRRRTRLEKIQSEVHSRILDRLTANEELLAYMQSSAGRKFLESAPISLDAGPRSMSAPLGRILWSVQIGLVLGAAGIGMRTVGAGFDINVSQPFQILGSLSIAMGIGFVLSAGVSFAISKRLGLLEPPATSDRIERAERSL